MVVKVGRSLLVAIVVVVLAGLATRYLAAVLKAREPESAVATAMLAVRKMFDLSSETNFPTWFSSGLLLVCALVAAAVAVLVRREGAPYGPHWTGLALVMGYLSLDETAELHERLNTPFEGMLGGYARGPLRFAWVVPAVLIVAVVGLAYLRFLAHLPARTRLLLCVGAALFVAGAVGMEMAGGIALDELEAGALYTLLNVAEETLEMLGATVVLCALLTLLRLEGTPTGCQLRLHLAAGAHPS